MGGADVEDDRRQFEFVSGVLSLPPLEFVLVDGFIDGDGPVQLDPGSAFASFEFLVFEEGGVEVGAEGVAGLGPGQNLVLVLNRERVTMALTVKWQEEKLTFSRVLILTCFSFRLASIICDILASKSILKTESLKGIWILWW